MKGGTLFRLWMKWYVPLLRKAPCMNHHFQVTTNAAPVKESFSGGKLCVLRISDTQHSIEIDGRLGRSPVLRKGNSHRSAIVGHSCE